MSTGKEIRERETFESAKQRMDYQHSLDVKLNKKAFWISIASIIIAFLSLIIAGITYLKTPNTKLPTITASVKAAPTDAQAKASTVEQEKSTRPGK